MGLEQTDRLRTDASASSTVGPGVAIATKATRQKTRRVVMLMLKLHDWTLKWGCNEGNHRHIALESAS